MWSVFMGLDNIWRCCRLKPTTLDRTDFEILSGCSSWLRNEKCWVAEYCKLQKCVKTLVAPRWNLTNGTAWTSKWQQYVISCRMYDRFNIVLWLGSNRICGIQHSSRSICAKHWRWEYWCRLTVPLGGLFVTCGYHSTSSSRGVLLGRALLVSSLPVRWSGLRASEVVLLTIHCLCLWRSKEGGRPDFVPLSLRLHVLHKI